MPLILVANFYYMECLIEYDTIMETVKEEVSREASQAVSPEGVSLYDEIRMVSRDAEKGKRMMREALVIVKATCNRFIAHAELTETTEDDPQVNFVLELSQRRSAGKEISIQTLLQSLTVNIIVGKYFASKNLQDLTSKYNGQATEDIKGLTNLLFEKTPPVYHV